MHSFHIVYDQKEQSRCSHVKGEPGCRPLFLVQLAWPPPKSASGSLRLPPPQKPQTTVSSPARVCISINSRPILCAFHQPENFCLTFLLRPLCPTVTHHKKSSLESACSVRRQCHGDRSHLTWFSNDLHEEIHTQPQAILHLLLGPFFNGFSLLESSTKQNLALHLTSEPAPNSLQLTSSFHTIVWSRKLLSSGGKPITSCKLSSSLLYLFLQPMHVSAERTFNAPLHHLTSPFFRAHLGCRLTICFSLTAL